MRDPPPEADRVKPLVLVAVGLVSMLVGFLLVYVPSRMGEPERRERATPAPREERAEKAPRSERPVLAVAPRPPESASPPAKTATSAPEPPPPTPETSAPATSSTSAPVPAGAALQAKVGNLFYWRCWDEGADDPLPSEHCDRLRTLEPQIDGQLDDVATCARERATGAGKLSLGLEIDFPAKNIRYWGGRSSTVANAAEVAGCIRQRWRIDLEAIRHAHSRYTIFVPIDLVPR